MNTSYLNIKFIYYTCLLCLIPFCICSQVDYSLSHLKAKNIGGKTEFKRILEQELIYPEKALQNETETNIIICFVVTVDSIVQEVRIDKSGKPELDAEALRVFKRIQWIPAFYQGDPIATFNCVKIPFSIKSYHKTCKKRDYQRISNPFEPVDTSTFIYKYNALNKKPFPYFPSQSTSIVRFFASNIKYPETAMKNNISGTVTIRFIVEPHGMITNIHATKPIAGGCTEETIRVVKMLKWYPGIYQGKAVRTWVNFSVNFKLTDQGGYIINPVLIKGIIN